MHYKNLIYFSIELLESNNLYFKYLGYNNLKIYILIKIEKKYKFWVSSVLVTQNFNFGSWQICKWRSARVTISHKYTTIPRSLAVPYALKAKGTSTPNGAYRFLASTDTDVSGHGFRVRRGIIQACSLENVCACCIAASPLPRSMLLWAAGCRANKERGGWTVVRSGIAIYPRNWKGWGYSEKARQLCAHIEREKQL